ncbi:MAG: hypothetical protein ABEI99_11525, partial [Halobaculum sp.]
MSDPTGSLGAATEQQQQPQFVSQQAPQAQQFPQAEARQPIQQQPVQQQPARQVPAVETGQVA